MFNKTNLVSSYDKLTTLLLLHQQLSNSLSYTETPQLVVKLVSPSFIQIFPFDNEIDKWVSNFIVK